MRRQWRAAYRCDCEGPPGPDAGPYVTLGKGAAKELKELTGVEYTGCPWRALNQPVVGDAMAATAFFESGQLREFWGDDPPAHMPAAVATLQRGQNAARKHDRDQKKSRKNKSGIDNP